MTLAPIERVRASSSLELLGRRRNLSSRQVQAGKRLARCYALAVVGQRHPGDGGGCLPTGYQDARVAAAQDYSQARDMLGGRLWPVAWAVACGDQAVQEVALARSMNPVACMTLLKLALDLLADRYGLPEGP